MYKPNFTITPKILKNIAKISAYREVILNAPLLPRWEVRLRKEAILKMTHHSTSIEGNRLTEAEVRFGIKTGANDFFYVEDVTDRVVDE